MDRTSKEQIVLCVQFIRQSFSLQHPSCIDFDRACTQTRRAKAKVWNIKDLERARSIPPRSTAINIPSERRVSHAVKRLSAIGAMRRKQSGMGLNGSLPVRRGEGEGVPSMGMTDEAPVGDDDSAANGREAELERRREERAAAALAK